MERLTVRDDYGYAHATRVGYYDIIDKLTDYEDTGLTPEEFKEAFDIVVREDKKIKKVVEDLKYYLDTNEENGVIYIPKFVIEKIVYGE